MTYLLEFLNVLQWFVVEMADIEAQEPRTVETKRRANWPRKR